MMRHNIRAESRADSLTSIYENHRNRRRIVYRLHHLPVIVDIRQYRVIFLAKDESGQTVELGEDISFTRAVFSTLKSPAKLTIRFKQIDIIAADEVLRHPHNRGI